MAAPRDSIFDPAIPPGARETPTPGTLGPAGREQDPDREEYMNDLMAGQSRPLTDEEEDAAEHDPGRPARTYAPHSERAPKPPAPGDEKLVEQGIEYQRKTPPPTLGEHVGDRSDPSELR